TPRVGPRSVHTYWKYCLQVDGGIVEGGAVELGRRLKERGISCSPRYIQKPAFMCEVFQKQRTFGASRYPFTLARPEAVDYDRAPSPGPSAGSEGVLVLPWTARTTEEPVDYIAPPVRDVGEGLTR